MLKSLLTTMVISASLGVGATTTPSRSSTTQSANTNTPYIQYEYETNEVNSVEDLVNGNIYKFEMNNIQYNSDLNNVLSIEDKMDSGTNFLQLVDYKLTDIFYNNVQDYIYNEVFELHSYEIDYYELIVSSRSTATTTSYSLQFNTDNDMDSTTFVVATFYFGEPSFNYNFSFYFICLDNSAFTNVSYVSASDYLGNATYVAPTSFYGIINQFIYTHFFNSESLNAQTTTLFGQTITLGEYLAQITTIIILFLMISFCIMLVIWAFKLVSNTFLLNRG